MRPLFTKTMITSERIIAKSAELFEQKGCKSITMDEISAVNGISKRTLYELFTDKSALLEECLNYSAEQKRAMSQRLRNESSNVLEYILSFQNYESKEAELKSNILIEETRKFFPDVYERTIAKIYKQQIEYTKSLLQEGIDDGLFEKDSGVLGIEAQILALLVSVGSIAPCESMRKSATRIDIFKSSVVVFLKGLSTDKGRRIIDNYFLTKQIK